MKVSTIQKIFLIIALTLSQLVFADDLKVKDNGVKSLINIEEYMLAKDYSSAISLCLSLHRSDPNSIIYLNKLTEIYIKIQDYDSAINYLNKSLLISPNIAETRINEGHIYLYKAIKEYEIALALNPKDKVVKDKLSRLKQVFN
jgi:tetratricopeptide (TPR) repeat protein